MTYRRTRNSQLLRIGTFAASALLALALHGQQPAAPQDPSPINGETYYVINQGSGLQADLNAGSTAPASTLVQNTRSFTSLTQRWALTLAPSGKWKISNISDGLCMDAAQTASPVTTLQQPCTINTPSQEWTIAYVSNGYSTVQNTATGLLLDVSGSSTTAAAQLVQSSGSATPAQSQLWLLRPAFLRGVDNAMLAKQEADRLADPTAFFNDAGNVQDSLQILKNHGVNMLRLRPTPLVVPGTTTPLYNTYTLGTSSSVPATCTANGCTAETDAADLALAKRAKALGMSIELSLFFDGASSALAPAAWSTYNSTQMAAAVYTYVKAQIEEYRAAGVMPDIVSVGNEVDTGFLSSGVASGAGGSISKNYSNFVAYQIQGMQAVLDAASDPALGPAIPAPLRCIHTTPSYSINSFYPGITTAGVPYEMVCESYYPIFHGALTAAQASSCTSTKLKNGQTEQTNLTNGAAATGKPILMIEIGERYETGYGTNGCFYPINRAGQRQFALDMQSTLKGLNNNLGAGITWWDATGTNVPIPGNSFANYTSSIVPAELYYWVGFTLFDDADGGNYNENFSAPTYNSVLPAMTAVGGKLDPTLAYKFVNLANGRILETASLSPGAGAALTTGVDTGVTSTHQQWQITGNGDGYFQIANLGGSASTANVLDNGASTAANSVVTLQAAAATAGQEWDVVSAGNGTHTIVNKQSGLVLGADTSSTAAGTIEQQAPSATNIDWVTPAGMGQQWTIVPVHISSSAAASTLTFSTPPAASLSLGAPVGNIAVTLQDAAGEIASSSTNTITLTITGPSYTQTFTATPALGVASFALTSTNLPNVGTYTVTASGSGLTPVSTTLNITVVTLTISANNLTRPYGTANPALTYTVTGFVNGDTISVLSGTPAISTTATPTSTVGGYPITVAAGTLAAANYKLAFNAGTLTITQVKPTVTLTASANSVFLQNPVTFTANVSSASGTPTGSVNFYLAGLSAPVGTGNLVNGAASFMTSSLPAGTSALTATYSGDANFTSVSGTASENVVDFTIAAGGQTAPVAPGGSATVTFTVSPVGSSTLPAAVALSASGLPAGFSATFSPASVAAGAGQTAVTVTVQIPQTASLEQQKGWMIGLAPVAFGVLLLPFSFRRSKGMRLLLPVALILAVASAVSGCASTSATQPRTYYVTVNATSGSLTHTASAILPVH